MGTYTVFYLKTFSAKNEQDAREEAMEHICSEFGKPLRVVDNTLAFEERE